MSDIYFGDTTLRDGPNSLWAQGMRTGMMLPVAEAMDNMGFESMELECGVSKKIVRELKEDPWERLRLVSNKITKTPLRGICSRSFNAFGMAPNSLYQLWMELNKRNGLSQMRMSDPSNDSSGWADKSKIAHEAGLDVILNIIFSISPKHTDEYFAEKARAAASLGVYRICFKDPGGLLTPERMRTVVPLIQANIGDTHLELHTHCTTGLGPLCALEGMKLGIPTIHTALPPLANGSSNPSLPHMLRNAEALGFSPQVDPAGWEEISHHFQFIAERDRLPVGEPLEYDEAQYQHQVPGGMISNLRFQLKNIGLEDRLQDVLDETVRVRADLGYPVMVTPLSQFVGTQAAINVIQGERYSQVTDEVIGFALGWWGEEASGNMDLNAKDIILDRGRARQMANDPPPDYSLAELRTKYGWGQDVSDEELLMRYVAGDEHVETLKAAGPFRRYDTSSPLAALLAELAKMDQFQYLAIEKGEFRLTADASAAK